MSAGDCPWSISPWDLHVRSCENIQMHCPPGCSAPLVFQTCAASKVLQRKVVPGLRPPAELSPGAVWQGCPRTALQEQPLSPSARQCAGRRYYLQLFVSTLGSGSWQSQPSCWNMKTICLHLCIWYLLFLLSLPLPLGALKTVNLISVVFPCTGMKPWVHNNWCHWMVLLSSMLLLVPGCVISRLKEILFVIDSKLIFPSKVTVINLQPSFSWNSFLSWGGALFENWHHGLSRSFCDYRLLLRDFS